MSNINRFHSSMLRKPKLEEPDLHRQVRRKRGPARPRSAVVGQMLGKVPHIKVHVEIKPK